MMASLEKDELQRSLMMLIPNLRAFAMSLVRKHDLADDLVQEALIRAFQNIHQFAAGSNLKAWLFTILRNAYLSHLRKRRFEVGDPDGVHAEGLVVPGGQSAHMELLEFQRALDSLPSDQREAIVLVGAEGFSYEEAALMCGCAVGTMKSRVSRARSKLAEVMGLSPSDELTVA